MCQTLAVELSTLTDEEMRLLVMQVQAEADRVEALRLKVLGEWDARAVWACDGAPNGVSWLAAQGNVARAHVSGLLRDARRLRCMSLTERAVADGGLAPAKARLLARAVNERTRDAFDRDEQFLIDTIRALTVDEAAKAIRFWQQLADPDGPDPRDRDANGLWVSQTMNGRWHLKGDLDVESGTALAGVLSAFVQQLRHERRDSGENLVGKGPQLRAEALLDMARRASAAPGSAAASKPLLWVIADQHSLDTGMGVADLVGGGAIAAVTAQRLSCDCDAWKVFLDPDGAITLNREQRRASGTQRRLLYIRDGGCRFPGCHRPASWCDAHHIDHWEHGGPTNLDNLCLLCSYHHHLCHEGGYRVRHAHPERIRGNGASTTLELIFTRPDGTRIDPPLIAA